MRKFARDGAETELDLDSTINATAKQGWLDVKMRPERHNKIKVLIFFDVGGSMNDHVKVCEELFSAVKSEFKHLEFFYFHNCLYEGVWKNNYRRWDEGISTYDIIHTYPKDYKLIFVGDASMSPYEILYPGGAVEYWNVESGATWMQRMFDHYRHAVWINPISERWWRDAESIDMIGQIMSGRMYGLTIDGLDQAMRELNR